MKKIHWNSDCIRTIEELEKKCRLAQENFDKELDFLKSYNQSLLRQIENLSSQTVQTPPKKQQKKKNEA